MGCGCRSGKKRSKLSRGARRLARKKNIYKGPIKERRK